MLLYKPNQKAKSPADTFGTPVLGLKYGLWPYTSWYIHTITYRVICQSPICKADHAVSYLPYDAYNGSLII